ncbi:MAG TPA: hypothetical protein VLJ86_10530, partial [Ramlibacter sp.]|nr:hypothetical protein [Ramlibacter sp.]
MKTTSKLLAFAAALIAVSTLARAEDIDIFLSRSLSASPSKPNVMFLVDNSANWSRASQWPNGTQGDAELAALSNIVQNGSAGMNIGLSGYTTSGGGGGYIRYGLRDMDVAANKTALRGIITYLRTGNTINGSDEKVPQAPETAGMFEVLRYFKGQSVFRGAKVTGQDPARSVDIVNNNGSATGSTAYSQSSTLGNWAINGSTYYKPASVDGCATNALIMIVNNAQGTPPAGDQSYTADSTTFSAGTSLPQITGVSNTSWTDEWARYLNQNGVTVYILDAWGNQRNDSYSKILERAATVGGGKYYAVKDQAEVEIAVGKILAEINAKDSTFASAALPVSAANRSQYLNQVFIGMFRPDPDAAPRWLGNLKQYKLGLTSAGDVELRDIANANAINTQTGFIDECAVSTWTRNSPDFWLNVNIADSESKCGAFPTLSGTTGSAYSDLPDGPKVVKGGVAQVIRTGNNPSATYSPAAATVADWAATNRNILTYDATATSKLSPLSTALVTTNTTSQAWTTVRTWVADFLKWVQGWDDNTGTGTPNSEYISDSTTERTRPSVHGDVIHAKPLPVSYSGTTYIYYGSNDGLLRAVNGSTGKEQWAFVAPEHYARLDRLKNNSPTVAFPGY